MIEASSRRSDTRVKIVEVAARLLAEQGTAAVTTRGVAEGAGVQAPMIYRLFGDKDGLLDAVAEHVLATYVSAKAATTAAADPLDDLRAGWATQIDFGLTNPAVFRLLSDPERVGQSPAAQAGQRILEARVHRIARTGRLRVSEARAVDILRAAGNGTIQTLLMTPAEHRDPGLADVMYEAALGQILTGTPAGVDALPLTTTVAFRALAPDLGMLSTGEQRLLAEWLDRVVDGLEHSP